MTLVDLLKLKIVIVVLSHPSKLLHRQEIFRRDLVAYHG